MKIWIVYQHAIPPSRSGGTRHHTLARLLMERGHEVSILSSSFHHFSRKEMERYQGGDVARKTEDGVPFVWFRTPTYLSGKFARLLGMFNFARQVYREGKSGRLGKPDLIIGSSPPMFAPYAAMRLARRFGVPFVLEVRDIWPQTVIDYLGSPRWHPMVVLMSVLEKALYSGAAKIVSVLPGSRRYLEGKGAAPSSFVYAPNGVDMEAVPGNPPLADGDGVLRLTYAGHHGYANNLSVILEAASLLEAQGYAKSVAFDLYGDGPYKQELIEQAKQMNLTSVRFLSPVSKALIYNTLARADAFLMPLRKADVFRWGISPNKLVDYMSCGRPILFGVSTQMNPVEEAGAGITCEPDNPRSLAEAVKRLAAMPADERRIMGENARRYAEHHYDIRRIADRLDAALREASNKRT